MEKKEATTRMRTTMTNTQHTEKKGKKKKWLMKSAMLCRMKYVWYWGVWSEVLYLHVYDSFFFTHFHYSLIPPVYRHKICFLHAEIIVTAYAYINLQHVCVHTENSLKGFFLLFIIIIFFIFFHILHQNPPVYNYIHTQRGKNYIYYKTTNDFF